MGTRSHQRILASVPRNCEHEQPWPPVDGLAIWSVAERVLICPIGLIVDQTPTVLRAHVAKSMVVVWQRIGILSVAIRHWLFRLLTTTIKVRIEKPMARQDSNHQTHSHGRHPPIIVGRRVSKPSVEHLLVEEIRDCGICLVLQQDCVTLTKGKCREASHF